MSVIKTGNATHDATCIAAEAARQLAVGTTAATAKAADIAFYRACVASALATGVNGGLFMGALRELGTGGT